MQFQYRLQLNQIFHEIFSSNFVVIEMKDFKIMRHLKTKFDYLIDQLYLGETSRLYFERDH